MGIGNPQPAAGLSKPYACPAVTATCTVKDTLGKLLVQEGQEVAVAAVCSAHMEANTPVELLSIQSIAVHPLHKAHMNTCRRYGVVLLLLV